MPIIHWVYRNKGIYYFKNKDFGNAKRLLIQSIDMDDKLPLSHFYLGWIYFNEGSKEEACKEWSTSLGLDDKDGKKAYLQYCR